MRHPRESLDIGNVASRIAYAFAKNRSSVFINEFFDGRGAIALRKPAGNSLLRQDVREQGITGAVELGERNDVVSHFGDIDKGVVDGRHSRANAQSFNATFQRGDAFS